MENTPTLLTPPADSPAIYPGGRSRPLCPFAGRGSEHLFAVVSGENAGRSPEAFAGAVPVPVQPPSKLPLCRVSAGGKPAHRVCQCQRQRKPGFGLRPAQGVLASGHHHRGCQSRGGAAAPGCRPVYHRHSRCQQSPKRSGDAETGHEISVFLPGTVAAQKLPGGFPDVPAESGRKRPGVSGILGTVPSFY